MKVELPPGVLVKDTTYPKYDDADKMVWDVGDHGQLTFYKVRGGRGEFWCIATLGIGKSRTPNLADRTYAITMDGNVVRVGKGPHVLSTVVVYIRKSRMAALQKYLDLYVQGMGDAGMIRDRIGSRRAEGQLRRSRGETWWTWNR